jgi:hypothetical protein
MAGKEDEAPKYEMTPKQRGDAVAWLKKHSPEGTTCPLCKNNGWIIPGHLVTPVVHSGGVILGGTPNYPQFMAVCTTCGYTIYMNAVLSGIMEEKEKDDAEAANG